MNKIEDFSNLSKANWLNLLPDLQNKKVLKIGTDSKDIIRTIFYCNVASLSCIGIPQIEIQNIISKFYRYDEDIRERFDIVIFDEVKLVDIINNHSDYFHKIKGLINETGVLLVCCPDGWGGLKHRYLISKALQNGSGKYLKYFICKPSSSEPYSIIPYIKDKKWLTYNYPNIEEKSFKGKVILKKIIKESFFGILGKYNPLSGLVIIYNAETIEYAHDKKEIGNASECIKDGAKEIEQLVNVYIAYRHSNKHYLFSYCQFDKILSQMKKIDYIPSKYGNHLEKEYNNLLLFKEHIEVYDSNKIVIPQAVYLNKLPERHESSMTVVRGVSLKYLVDKNIYHSNYRNVIDLLNQATDMQICFQQLTEINIKEVIYDLDSEYFQNYLGLDLVGTTIEGSCIQHCDFAANNIHWNAETNKWGIIDWEGLTQGMPLMLDLFSMLTSFRFTVRKKKYKKYQEKYYDAIIDTYFSDNWISRCVLINLKKYCQAYNVSEKNMYNYFVLFLLFQVNKYRIFNTYEYRLLFEKMLRFAVENKEKFIGINPGNN